MEQQYCGIINKELTMIKRINNKLNIEKLSDKKLKDLVVKIADKLNLEVSEKE